MGLATFHCDLQCAVLLGPCAVNDPWYSEVFSKLNWVCKVKCRSLFPPDWTRRWRYDLTLNDDPTLSYCCRTWPSSINLSNFAPERLIMSTSLLRPAIQRSKISLGHVDVMMELVSMQTPNHEDCSPLASECCLTTCTIRPNLLDENDVTHSAHVSLGTWKTDFCCTIVSAILASCALPIMYSMFWMSGGSDNLTLHVYHVWVSIYMLELRSVGKGVQRVWLALDTTWPRTRRIRHPRAFWSTCDHCCSSFPLPHILQTCPSSHSIFLSFWKSTEY